MRILLSCLLLAAASPTLAQPVMTDPASVPPATIPPTMSTSAPIAQAAPEKQICRKSYKSGTRIQSSKKECHTKAEWDQIDKDNRDRATSGG